MDLGIHPGKEPWRKRKDEKEKKPSTAQNDYTALHLHLQRHWTCTCNGTATAIATALHLHSQQHCTDKTNKMTGAPLWRPRVMRQRDKGP